MQLSPGARLGTYEIVAGLGTGGMGEVYRARDTRLKRDVAIKVIRGAWAADPDRLKRFQREAEMLASLNHPNIAAIYGVEEFDGIKALILELVEGATLADRVAQGSLPIRDVLRIGRQIVDALDAAHEHGIVHRDLKPANVKVRQDGAVKLLDFGLARGRTPESDENQAESPTLTSPAFTNAGVILGTAAYMSPEQARGLVVDKRTDIWSFGCVLYEMVTGRRAFTGATMSDTIAAILEREPDWSALPASTPRSLAELLRRCLEKDRKARLRDIADANSWLEAPETVASHAKTPDASSRKRWSPMLLGAAFLAGVIATSVAAWILANARTAGPPAPTEARLQRVTSDASFSTEPALSSDGSLIVYASDRPGGGQLDLWLQRTAGGQPIPLTHDPADDRQPTFSPDGNEIAFRSNRAGGGVFVMPTFGGSARLVAEEGYRPRFSPDGKRIAYWTGPWLSSTGPRGLGFAVFVVGANGGQPMRVAENFVGARDPVWSPDGRSLLFFGRPSEDTSFDWWWISLDRNELVQTGAYQALSDRGLNGLLVTPDDEGGAPFDALPAAWTAAGVVFSARLGDSINLWRIQVSQQNGRVVGSSLERLTRGAGLDRAGSADGVGRIAFGVTTEGVVSLTLPLDPNTGKVQGPVTRLTFEAGAYGGRNSLDHSGRLLAYPKMRGDENEIWIKDLTTGQERHLVTTARSQLNPVIAPDGSTVAYSVSAGSAVTGYVVLATGGRPAKVCDQCILLGWFGDNRRILIIDNTPGSPRGRVGALDVVDGTKQDLVVDAQSNIGRADVSPDGRWLSFFSRRQVWLAPIRPGRIAEEKEWHPVFKAEVGAAERACGWSPDGRLLYVLLERDGFRDLYAQRIDNIRGVPLGDPFVVQHLHDPRLRWGSTPFGNAIVSNAFVFHQFESAGGIWLLDSTGRRAGAVPSGER